MKKILSKKIIIALVILVLLVGLHYLSILKPIENSLQLILRPLQSGLTSAANFLGDQITLIATKQRLKSTNDELRSQIINLWQENSRLKLIEQENQTLKAELHYTQDNPKYTFVTAKIIAQNPIQNPSVIIINAGKKHNLKTNLPVLVNDGVIVGKLSTINQNTSQVVLLSNNNSRISASFTGLTTPSGIVTGQHNLSITMNLIPSDIIVEEDSMVITSGAQRAIPAGYLIGHVQNITKLPNDLFQSASIKPIVDYNQLKYVIIPITQ